MADVVDLDKKRQEKKSESEEALDPLKEAEERNKALKERKARERAEANKAVLRSYRIKH